LYRARTTIGAMPMPPAGETRPREYARRRLPSRDARVVLDRNLSPTSPDAAIRGGPRRLGRGRKGRAVYTRPLAGTTLFTGCFQGDLERNRRVRRRPGRIEVRWVRPPGSMRPGVTSYLTLYPRA